MRDILLGRPNFDVDVAVEVGDAELREDLRTFGKAWWLFLVAGILWIWVGFAVLSFSSTSFAIISLMVGFVLILAGIALAIFLATTWGMAWRWQMLLRSKGIDEPLGWRNSRLPPRT